MIRTKRTYRRWLLGLPPNEPFCRGFNCPLEQYNKTWTQDLRGWVGAFTERVDRSPKQWHQLTPKMCLDILAEVA